MRSSRCSTARAGLSPRGRGNQLHSSFLLGLHGSIPAWAGKPPRSPSCPPSYAVYPRVGGETYDGGQQYDMWLGLSPRGRGNPGAGAQIYPTIGSIPAWAGKPTGPHGLAAPSQVYPRVGGETLVTGVGDVATLGLSPRGRGNLPVAWRRDDAPGSIPAWAGKPCCPLQARASLRVYPRVGGETGSTP